MKNIVLVDKQSVIDCLCNDKCNEELRWCDDGYCPPVNRIMKLPSIQIEHNYGEWLKDEEICGEQMWRCSKCKVSEAVPTSTSFITGIAYPQWHWCPNCGTIMKSEDDFYEKPEQT